ncbi:MAG: hypothetical protein IIB73_02195, partial [Proteobacteria bacterium]|nr:hypothetical protein [Pseudomonadota bacterium]
MVNDTPRRRWYQFSFRTLLVVMLVSVVAVGWIGRRIQRAQRNRDFVSPVEQAVIAIEKSGGHIVESKHELRRFQTLLEQVFDDPGNPGDRVRVLKVTYVVIGNDAGLEHFRVLTDLQTLGLVGDDITDAGLEHLKGTSNLLVMTRLPDHLTEAGLKKLQQALPNCHIF